VNASLLAVLVYFALLNPEPPAQAENPLDKLAPNTWVAIKADHGATGRRERKGPVDERRLEQAGLRSDGKRVLFYDRWHDKKHGGYTIYGNCLFSFDPATAKLIPVAIDHWVKRPTDGGGYRTEPLPDAKDAMPCSRHVYHGFDYVPELKAVFLCQWSQSNGTDPQGRASRAQADLGYLALRPGKEAMDEAGIEGASAQRPRRRHGVLSRHEVDRLRRPRQALDP